MWSGDRCGEEMSHRHVIKKVVKVEAEAGMWPQVKESQGRSWKRQKRILLGSLRREPALPAL